MTTPPQTPDTPPTVDEVLSEGTFTTIKEPRGEHRLQLDGSWHQISPNYITVQQILNGVALVLVAVATVVVAVASHFWWVWLIGAAFLVPVIVGMVILPRQARAYGYMLRADDIVFRRGILWQRMVAVPYGRMQLVDVTQGPLDRAFKIAQLKLITAAATTNVSIPGLPHPVAEELRDVLITVAETRRTGL